MVRFHFFACGYPDVPTPFVEEAILTPFLCFCPLCRKLIDHRELSLFLSSLFCSIDLCAYSYASTRLFWLPRPCNIVWCKVWWSLLLCSFSKLLQLFRIAYVPFKFLKCLVYICEIYYWYFNQDCSESVNCFGKYGHFHDVNSSNPWTWYMLPFICVFLNLFFQCCVGFSVQISYLLG